jgi:hypothetical protein
VSVVVHAVFPYAIKTKITGKNRLLPEIDTLMESAKMTRSMLKNQWKGDKSDRVGAVPGRDSAASALPPFSLAQRLN